MTNYILKLMGGEQFIITEQEFKQLGSTQEGKVFIKSCSSLINISSISAVYPENNADDIQNKKEQQVGVLHTGERVKRYFGEWVMSDNQIPDDSGNYKPVRIDPAYYPEVARDCVMTIEKYEQVKHLPKSEILNLAIKGTSEPRENSGFESIKQIQNL